MQNLASRVSLGFIASAFVLFFLFPGAQALLNLFSDANASALSEDFFKLLGQSFFVTFFHAAIASLSVALIASTLCLAIVTTSARKLFLHAYHFFGVLLFSLPGVVLAATYIVLAERNPVLPGQGLLAIILCHVAMNVMFVATALVFRLKRWLPEEGSRQLELCQSFGVSSFGRFRFVVFPVIGRELRVWIPLVFVWCFFSFATVLMLSGRPVLSSPEVLLFYSLSQSSASARVLCLMGVYLFVAALVYRVVPATSFNEARVSGVEVPVLLGDSFPFLDFFRMSRVFFDLVFVFIFFYVVRAMVISQSDFQWSSVFVYGAAMTNSLKLCALSAITISLVFLFVSLVSSRVRSRLFFLSLLGGSLLLAFWVKSDISYLSFLNGYLLVALAVSFSLLPLISRWVDRRCSSIPLELIEGLRSLGLGEIAIWRYARWPVLKDVYFRVLSLSLLWTVGEIAFSELLLGEETLALVARRMASRYEFSGLTWVLFFIVLLCGVVFIFERLFLRKRLKGFQCLK